MKFFWKLYFSIMTITLICFSVGGTMLIQTSFNSSFDREVESIYQENDILVNSLTLELYPYLEEMTLKWDSTQERTNLLKNVFCNMIVETFRGNISFCVRDESGNVIYQNDTFKDQHKLFKRISQNERGSIVLKDKNHYKLQALRCFSLNETKLYFENVRDISELFLNRENQFRTLFYYTLVLLFVSTIVIFIVTRWLVYPIKKLSKATKGIADRKVFIPVTVSSEDEIGQLTKDFNTMAKRLEITMKELHEAVERQEMFVGNFAHELKTPLTSIIGYGDMLRSKRLSEEEIINYSHLIVEEGKRLESMSMKLLNLIVLKKQDFKMYKISAQTFVQGIEDMVDLLMKENNIQYIVVLSTNRLWRSDLVKVLLHRELKKNNVDIKVIDRLQYSIYTQSPNEIFAKGMVELLDIYERLEIALKLKRGRLQKAKQLQYTGGKKAYIEQTKTTAGTRVLPMSDEVYEAFKRVVSSRKNPK